MDGAVWMLQQTDYGLQTVYLDFDGGNTVYDGEILAISNVSVAGAGLTEERIASITAALNALYSTQGIRFVTERPAEGAFSTVYIGKTDAFAPYGSFAGVAEMVDTGNRTKNDNAFVLLDHTASDAELIDMIAHETDHLLGVLDHGGSGLERFAAKSVGPGVTSTGLFLTSNTLIVSAGGTARSTNVSRKGAVHVSNGGAGRKNNSRWF